MLTARTCFQKSSDLVYKISLGRVALIPYRHLDRITILLSVSAVPNVTVPDEVLAEINHETVSIALELTGMNRRTARPLHLLSERLVNLTD